MATQGDADNLLSSPDPPPSLWAAGQPIRQPARICQTPDLKNTHERLSHLKRF